jgi:hypothetical protein
MDDMKHLLHRYYNLDYMILNGKYIKNIVLILIHGLIIFILHVCDEVDLVDGKNER